ncbi:MAG TPA: hypothetical protein VF265_02155 [Nevskiaceae bacterium]
MNVDPKEMRRLADEATTADVAAMQAALKLRNDMLRAAAEAMDQVESDLREIRRSIRHAPMQYSTADGRLPSNDFKFTPKTMISFVPLDEGGDPVPVDESLK